MKKVLILIILSMGAESVGAQTCEQSSTMPFHISAAGVWASHGYSNDHRRSGMSIQKFNQNIYTLEGVPLSDRDLRRLQIGVWLCIPVTPGYAYRSGTNQENVSLESILADTITTIRAERLQLQQEILELENVVSGLESRTQTLVDSLAISTNAELYPRGRKRWATVPVLTGLLIILLITLIALAIAIRIAILRHRRYREVDYALKDLERNIDREAVYLREQGVPLCTARYTELLNNIFCDRRALGNAALREGIRPVPLKSPGFLYEGRIPWFYAPWEGDEIRLPEIGRINPENHPRVFDEHRDIAHTLSITVWEKEVKSK